MFTNMEGTHTQERDCYISKCESSPTLSINEKVEQHIKEKDPQTNALRFWVEGDVIPLCVSDSCLILV